MRVKKVCTSSIHTVFLNVFDPWMGNPDMIDCDYFYLKKSKVRPHSFRKPTYLKMIYLLTRVLSLEGISLWITMPHLKMPNLEVMYNVWYKVLKETAKSSCLLATQKLKKAETTCIKKVLKEPGMVVTCLWSQLLQGQKSGWSWFETNLGKMLARPHINK
jgi:hypothetical protein